MFWRLRLLRIRSLRPLLLLTVLPEPGKEARARFLLLAPRPGGGTSSGDYGILARDAGFFIGCGDGGGGRGAGVASWAAYDSRLDGAVWYWLGVGVAYVRHRLFFVVCRPRIMAPGAAKWIP